jgi:hypothetical protein
MSSKPSWIHKRNRRALSSLEVLVAFTLLTSVLGVSTALIVKHGRLLTSQRDYRIALDELSSQLDRLTALPQGERAKALENLVPSSFAVTKLPGATLTGEITDADVGQRISLRLHWDEPQRTKAPVALSAWVVADGETSSQRSPTGDSP